MELKTHFMTTSTLDIVDEPLVGEHAERRVVSSASDERVRLIWLFALDCMR